MSRWIKNAATILLIGLCVLYLLNPGLGFLELLPDNLPIVGNLDEGAAASALVLLIQSLRKRTHAV
jgi:uncharacterized membrane protein YkvA (DUF1232 family)